MKKYFNFFAIVLLLSTISGCSNFLDIKPVNSMIPVSLEDYESVLMGGYPKKEFFIRTEYMTDNVYANVNSKRTVDLVNEVWYVWAESHQLEGTTVDDYWGQLYKSVYYANSVLDELSQRVPSAAEKNLYERVVGEAYALRAYSYFYLINLYADTYSEVNLNKPGVPMPLTAVDVNMNAKDNVREPIGKVWEQIVKDMNQASDKLAGKAAVNQFRFDYNTVQLLKARVYLFMENYDDAIACATDVINSKTLFDMNNLQSYIDKESDRYAFGGDYGFLDSDYGTEVLFYVGGKANYNVFYYDENVLKTSPELLALCDYPDKMDYRKYIFASFLDMSEDNSKAVGTTVYRMYANQGKSLYYIGFKLSEAYVTRAEAYARKGNKDLAVADLNALLVTRFKKGDFEPLLAKNFNDQQMIERVLRERRLETAFDGGLRWFDLRRLGKPEITHNYTNGTSRTLKKDDLRYVLQIPLSEQESSPNMPLNPR